MVLQVIGWQQWARSYAGDRPRKKRPKRAETQTRHDDREIEPLWSDYGAAAQE